MIEQHVLDEIKRISLVDYLAYLGYQPQKHFRGSYFYHSPFRNERTPSFEVKADKIPFHGWSDYGITGKNNKALGGNIICFAMEYHQKSFIEAVKMLAEYQNLDIKPVFQMPSNEQAQIFEKEQREKKYRLSHEQELSSKALLKYIEGRLINLDIAKKYCTEVHFEYNNAEGTLKQGYGIGLKNEQGGFEISTPYGKFSIGQKNFSVIQAERESKNWIVFEGKYDFLAYMTEKKYQSPPSNVLILNSVSFASGAISYLQNKETDKIMLCPDFDRAGYLLLQEFGKAFGENCYNMLPMYEGYKDYNDKIRDIKVPNHEDYLLFENPESKHWIILESKESLQTCQDFIRFTKRESKDANIMILQNIFADQKALDFLATKQVDTLLLATAFKNHQEISIIDKTGDVITQKFQNVYPQTEDLREHYREYKKHGHLKPEITEQTVIKAEAIESRANGPHHTLTNNSVKRPWEITEEEYHKRIQEIALQIRENVQKQTYDKEANVSEILKQNASLKQELRQLKSPFDDGRSSKDLSYQEIVLGAEQRGLDVPIHIIQNCEKNVPTFKQIAEDVFLLENDKTINSHILDTGKFMEESDLLEFKNNQATAGYYYKKSDVEELLSHQSCYINKPEDNLLKKLHHKEEFLSLVEKGKALSNEKQLKL